MTQLFGQLRARSPHYDDTHEAVSASVRSFVEREFRETGEIGRISPERTAAGERTLEM